MVILVKMVIMTFAVIMANNIVYLTCVKKAQINHFKLKKQIFKLNFMKLKKNDELKKA
jgi:hypothetical protein